MHRRSSQRTTVPDPAYTGLDALKKATGISRGRSKTQQTLGDLLEWGVDGLMGAIGLPINESKASTLGELLTAAVPIAGGVKMADRLGDAIAGIAKGTHALDRPGLIRAASQGFDPRPMWHETHRENLPSLLRDGFDLSKGRARLSDELMPDGVFLKPNGKRIGLTVEDADAAQVPLVHRAQNTAVFNDREQMKQFLIKDEQYRQLLENAEQVDKSYIPKYEALEKVAWGSGKRTHAMTPDEEAIAEAARDELDRFLEEWEQANKTAATAARERGTQVFRDRGHDSVRVGNDAGSMGRSVDTTVILDPEKVRSIYAAFDPLLKDSKSLLASLAGGATLGSLLQRRQPTNDRRTPPR